MGSIEASSKIPDLLKDFSLRKKAYNAAAVLAVGLGLSSCTITVERNSPFAQFFSSESGMTQPIEPNNLYHSEVLASEPIQLVPLESTAMPEVFPTWTVEVFPTSTSTPEIRVPFQEFFLNSSDTPMGHNKRMFFKRQSPNRKDGNLDTFSGFWDFAPGKKKSVNKEFGPYAGPDWKTIVNARGESIQAYGLCASVSMLRQVATELGGFETYMETGPKRIRREVKETIGGVKEEYWSATYACGGCEREKDVIFRNQSKQAKRLSWKVSPSGVKIWVEPR